MTNIQINEKELNPVNGMLMLLVLIAVCILSVAGIIIGGFFSVAIPIICAVILVVACVCFAGLKVINPNEALVLTLFGKYYGTIKKHGFFFVNPFVTARNPVVEGQGGAATSLLEELNESGKKAGNKKKASTNKKVSTKVLTFTNGTQ